MASIGESLEAEDSKHLASPTQQASMASIAESLQASDSLPMVPEMEIPSMPSEPSEVPSGQDSEISIGPQPSALALEHSAGVPEIRDESTEDSGELEFEELNLGIRIVPSNMYEDQELVQLEEPETPKMEAPVRSPFASPAAAAPAAEDADAEEEPARGRTSTRGGRERRRIL